MCGINGFNWPDEDLVRYMNLATAHRGPDNDGVFVDESVSLGNRRLAIIDLSDRANQPLSNETNDVWITYNGEVYNFKGLRDDLTDRGHRFRSESDVETIIHLYEEKGIDCVKDLEGMFAFCIYDSKKRIILLARDRLGIKPLYYHHEGKRLIFSSEIRGILQHPIKRVVDDGIVFDYLYYGRLDHTERTFFKGILKVQPASTVVIDLQTGKLEERRYWNPRASKVASVSLDRSEAVLMELLRRAVNSHMVSDVPVGSCLSGGLDSSTVVTLVPKDASRRFETFSATFPGLTIDESRYISDVATRLGVDSNTVTPVVSDLHRQFLEFIEAQEEPVGSASPFAQFKVMELAHKKGAKVLLDGQGGDELFAGYPHYLPPIYKEMLSTGSLIGLGRMIANHGIVPLFVALTPPALKRWALGSNLAGLSARYQIALGLSRGFVDAHIRTDSSVGLTTPGTVAEAQYLDLSQGLQSLLRYEDKNSMHFSVEARVPLLDRGLVEFALGLPLEYKYNHGLTKFILRSAMKDLLPPSTLSRLKLGFPAPTDDWLREKPMRSLVHDVISSEEFRNRRYFEQADCLRLLEMHQRGEMNLGVTIWRWLNLEMWLRMFIDKGTKNGEAG